MLEFLKNKNNLDFFNRTLQSLCRAFIAASFLVWLFVFAQQYSLTINAFLFVFAVLLSRKWLSRTFSWLTTWKLTLLFGLINVVYLFSQKHNIMLVSDFRTMMDFCIDALDDPSMMFSSFWGFRSTFTYLSLLVTNGAEYSFWLTNVFFSVGSVFYTLKIAGFLRIPRWIIFPLLLLIPEIMLSSGINTHDLPPTFFGLMAFYYILTLNGNNQVRNTLLAFSSAFFLAYIRGGLVYVYIPGFFVCWVYNLPRKNFRSFSVLGAILLFVFFVPSFQNMKTAELESKDGLVAYQLWVNIVGHADFDSDGSFEYIRDHHLYSLTNMDRSKIKPLAIEKLKIYLFSDPLELFQSLKAKVSRLTNFQMSLSFYNRYYAKKLFAFEIIRGLNNIYVFFMVLSIFTLIFSPINWKVIGLLIPQFLFLCLFSLFLETQPRYFMPFHLINLIVIGYSFNQLWKEARLFLEAEKLD